MPHELLVLQIVIFHNELHVHVKILCVQANLREHVAVLLDQLANRVRFEVIRLRVIEFLQHVEVLLRKIDQFVVKVAVWPAICPVKFPVALVNLLKFVRDVEILDDSQQMAQIDIIFELLAVVHPDILCVDKLPLYKPVDVLAGHNSALNFIYNVAQIAELVTVAHAQNDLIYLAQCGGEALPLFSGQLH